MLVILCALGDVWLLFRPLHAFGVARALGYVFIRESALSVWMDGVNAMAILIYEGAAAL